MRGQSSKAFGIFRRRPRSPFQWASSGESGEWPRRVVRGACPTRLIGGGGGVKACHPQPTSTSRNRLQCIHSAVGVVSSRRVPREGAKPVRASAQGLSNSVHIHPPSTEPAFAGKTRTQPKCLAQGAPTRGHSNRRQARWTSDYKHQAAAREQVCMFAAREPFRHASGGQQRRQSALGFGSLEGIASHAGTKAFRESPYVPRRRTTHR